MLAAASPASVSRRDSNSFLIRAFPQVDPRQILGEPRARMGDAQRAALAGGLVNLLAERHQLVEAVDAREAADVVAHHLDRLEVARAERARDRLDVLAPVGEEARHQLAQRGLHAELNSLVHMPFSTERDSVSSSMSTLTGFAT